jgi:hypothetical protein
LGTKSFVEKRDRTNNQGLEVGYKNGLKLNAELALKDNWSIEDITQRTASLANQVIGLFAYEGELE